MTDAPPLDQLLAAPPRRDRRIGGFALASFGLIQDLIWAGITPSRFLIAVLFGPPAFGLFAVGASIVRSRMRRASLPRLTGR